MPKYLYGKKRKISQKKIRKIGGFLFLFFGISTLLYFFFPILSFHIYLSSAFARSNMQSPLPQRFVVESNNSLSSLLSSQITNVAIDYYDARNWSPMAKRREISESIKEYGLSIPSQGILKAEVSANDFDLSNHLVEYFTTSSNPILRGTSVIFGHSSLPQWFDSKKYTTIFAKLHLLKEGDEIILTVHGKDYKYKVFEKAVMDADDEGIFSQSFDNSYITLVTCTPPGTTWKRLIIRASLEHAV